MLRILVIALASFSIYSNAAVTRFVQPGGETAFAISKYEPNRIAIKGDRITSFVKITGSFSQANDPTSGDLFITPEVNAESQKNISGFITTEAGKTIQVFLALKDIPSTNTELQLRVYGENPEKATTWERSFGDQRLAALKLAKAIKNGDLLPGFTTQASDKGIRIDAQSLKPFSARIHSMTVGNYFLGEDIKITNHTKHRQLLSERMLSDKLVMGVWIISSASRPQRDMDTFYVEPGESIRAIRIRHNTIK